MRYVGGKYQLAGRFAHLVNAACGGGVLWEPFCGALGSAVRFSPRRHVLGDANPYLIRLLRAVLKEDWDPDLRIVNRELWARYRANPDPEDPWTAFLGFGCSFGGDCSGGYTEYSRQGPLTWKNFPIEAAHSLRRTKRDLAGREVILRCEDFMTAEPPADADAAYLDPPYVNTTGYKATGKFDHEAFWDAARRLGRIIPVLISEETAPPDFREVWTGERLACLSSKKKRRIRIEKLFLKRPSKAKVLLTRK